MFPERKNGKPQQQLVQEKETNENISSCSISDLSLQWDEAAKGSPSLPLATVGGADSGIGHACLDLEIGVNDASGSVDVEVLSDDELGSEDDDEFDDGMMDEEDDENANGRPIRPSDNLRMSMMSIESILQQEKDAKEERGVDALEIGRVRSLRRIVIGAFFLGMGATGALTYLQTSGISGILGFPDVDWLVPVITIASWLLVAMTVVMYDRAAWRAVHVLRVEASKNRAIVNSLFPENVRSRMLMEESKRQEALAGSPSPRMRKGSGHSNGSGSVHSGKSYGGGKSSSKSGNASFKSGIVVLKSGNASLSSMLSLGSKEKRRKRHRERRQLRGGRRPDTGGVASNNSSPANATAEITEMTDESGTLTSSKPENRTAITDDDDDDQGLIPRDILTTKPIADFFPHCTVLFADIVGFTAWSSVRDPTAVFTLLESLYSCFDGLARRLKVFKVETIGDCYVAVTGLPEVQKDHAIRMAKFSRACMSKIGLIVRALEKHLGPDTGDLSMRFGLHSGPVTAGVMRGEKSRFQLFGDTVNTAARIETTGMRDKVHLSESTAEHLKEAGKGHWVQARETKVQAKGKGQLQTYWLNMSRSGTSADATSKTEGSTAAMSSSDSLNNISFSSFGHKSFGGGVKGIVALFEKEEKLNKIGEQTRRQADYTVEVLSKILKKIVAQRWGTNGALAPTNPTPVELKQFASMEATLAAKTHQLPIDEINDALNFSSCLNKPAPSNMGRVQLPRNISDQLKDFVATIASMYTSHSFHCWEHASHVTISLTKLHSRLVDPSKKGGQGHSMTAHTQWQRNSPKGNHHSRKGGQSVAPTDDGSFGISNDPLTEFALVFAAMIHDVDHPGRPNARLIKDNANVTKKYGKRSPSEQHSLDVAWSVFLRPTYQQLRRFIYSTESEMERFRQLVFTLVMATDIVDRELLKERNKRWERAFAANNGAPVAEKINQRATLVLETMIQASNIAHCTQHWNIYIKWNKKLFQEMCELYKTGRQSGQKDPAEFWYQGELSFFDDVVIPLANKLMSSGAFGDDAEEFLTYAKSNRRDWEAKGREMVLEYLSEIRGSNVSKGASSQSRALSRWASESSLACKPAPSPPSQKWSKPRSTKHLET